ncbi:transglutaminase domain-containing protein [Saccharibacillus deserti]|uniref:transglutaminase domain-containing protein n=1 Tax=Saccharibacillus deserti TaxID=1634444 RepID=UPI001FEC0F34|nr:transglutaminase domain-containing protein [Saccharibacillus deserti]
MQTDESRIEREPEQEGNGLTGEEIYPFSLDAPRMQAISAAFEAQRKLAAAREKECFGVFAGPLSEQEQLALEFLYAHMPINDLADYDGELFLTHVRQALRMREDMPWGASVPDDLFLHYVLPPRINNERIENYRDEIAGELRDRVRALSMSDAVLETNYWCYEKATYTGSDARTISPLGMIRSAKGRCGEESTLATAALRSIGIPARQCYTPRWAHVDDNHAWVEAWADGAWHFIGACEPEPALDRGWFDGPARRAMLVHTRVPAGYAGPEPVTHGDGVHTEINLLANYAPVRTLEVRVTDEAGSPAAGADVQFQLYNYAELHPMASMRTDEAGMVRFVTGFGDLVVRAARSGSWDEAIVYGSRAVKPTNLADSAEEAAAERVELTLSQSGQPSGRVDFELTPPPERAGAAEEPLPEEKFARHRSRTAEGERIRAAFEAGFAGEAESAVLADRLGLDAARVFKVLGDARGNIGEIEAFLEEHTPRLGEWPLRLLESLTSKDLIDTDRATLDDHLLGGLEAAKETGMETGIQSGTKTSGAGEGSGAIDERFLSYVLGPRVRWEKLSPYRSQLRSAFAPEDLTAYRADPQRLAGKVASDWTVLPDRTPVPGKASPAGTFALKSGDRESVEIMLVALCRSLGIPARLHPAALHPQAWVESGWIDLERPTEGGSGIETGTESKDDADSKDVEAGSGAPVYGTLRLRRAEPAAAPHGRSAPAVEASYRENFTLARLEQGFYTTLNYPFRRQDVYESPFELEAGDYRMTTGIRLQNGRVLGRLYYFTIQPGRETGLEPVFREPEESVPVLAAAEGGSLLSLPGGAERTLAELSGRGGALVAWIDYRLEPTRHLLREAGELKETLEAQNVPLVFIVHSGIAGNDTAASGLQPGSLNVPEEIRPFVPKPLPSGAIFAYDRSGEAFAGMNENCPPPGTEYPHLFVLDPDLNIRYAESGYKPGSCAEALQILRAVRG